MTGAALRALRSYYAYRPQSALLQDCCSDGICPSGKTCALSRGDAAASASCFSSLRVTVWSLAFVHSSPCLMMFLCLSFSSFQLLTSCALTLSCCWNVVSSSCLCLQTENIYNGR